MAQLVRISSGAPWEPVAAYSRAVEAGEFVAVSGTTAIDERGLVVGAGKMYVQARRASRRWPGRIMSSSPKRRRPRPWSK